MLLAAGIEDTQRWTFFESQQNIKDVNGTLDIKES